MKKTFYILTILTLVCLTEKSNAQYKGGSYSGYYSVLDSNAIVSITRLSSDADDYKLNQNYPNPFNPETIINYEIKSTGNVYIGIYDILGNEVAILSNQKHAPGKYSVTFDGRNFSSGVYFYKIISGNFSDTKKMILNK